MYYVTAGAGDTETATETGKLERPSLENTATGKIGFSHNRDVNHLVQVPSEPSGRQWTWSRDDSRGTSHVRVQLGSAT